jgi:hypothetical protein
LALAASIFIVARDAAHGGASIAMPVLAYWWSMILSDLPSPAEASSQNEQPCQGFAQAGTRYPLFGIML